MSGRILRSVVCGLALVAVCTLLMPPPAHAADLRGVGGSFIPGWSWLGSLWSEVGGALNSLFGEGDGETPAPVARTWDKQGGGVDPNGPPSMWGSPSLLEITTCDPGETCTPIAG
jgi:hypothetical protein